MWHIANMASIENLCKPLLLVLQELWETLYTQKMFKSFPTASGNEHTELKTQTFHMIMSQRQHIVSK